MSAAGPTIVAATVGAGHDGRAEVVVELLHPNGGRSRLSVPQEAAVLALDAAGVTTVDGLVGRPWRALVDGVQRAAAARAADIRAADIRAADIEATDIASNEPNEPTD